MTSDAHPADRAHHTRMFVLREPRALEELVAVARLHGWTYVEQRRPATWLRVVVLEAGMPGLELLHHEYDNPELSGIVVRSMLGPEPIQHVATLVQGMLVPWMLTELSAALEGTSGTHDRALAVRRAGLGAPIETDPVLLGRFRVAAADVDPGVRGAAVEAMFDTSWPECLPVLRELAANDHDPEFRQLAGTAADVLAGKDPEAGPIRIDVPDLFAEDGEELHRIAMDKLGR